MEVVEKMNIRLDCFPGGKHKAVTMSYDDGRIEDRKLVEIFNKYGIRGTFNLNSGMFGNLKYIEAAEVAGLYTGHEVAVHTVNHLFLENLPVKSLHDEILKDREALEELVGYPVRGMSYPYGTYSDDVIAGLPYLGIEYSRTVISHEKFSIPDDFLKWDSSCRHAKNLMTTAQRFLEYERKGFKGLLYVWGHSYEFEDDGNWDLMESFCRYIGNNEKIWYATNIEVADYIKALKNLKISVSGNIIYNPSAISVWISVNDTVVKIDGGKTITIKGV